MVEKGNADWALSKPLYGMSKARKDWCETIRDFLEEECGGEVASLGKSVCHCDQRGFGYGMGGNFATPIKQTRIRES